MAITLSRTDAAHVFTLIEECSDLWADTAAWQRHLAAGVERIVGGIAANVRVVGEGLPIEFHLGTRYDAKIESATRECFRLGDHRRVPGSAMIDADTPVRGSYCGTGSRLSTPSAFRQSEYYQHYLQPNHLHQLAFVTAGSATRDSALGCVIALFRARREAEFSARDLDVLHAIGSGIGSCVGARLATRGQKGRFGLSPRVTETLDALLLGDSEKEAAARLSISEATVHEYVRSLYRHFEVRSRAELMAYFVQRRPRARAANE